MAATKKDSVGRQADWHAFRIVVPQEQADDLAAEFFELGSCGVHFEEQPEDVRLHIYFSGDSDKAQLADQIRTVLGRAGLTGALPTAERIADQDWNAQWRRFFTPVWIGADLVVRPSWIPVDLQPDQIDIVIDPKRAFGTGGHESTRLALEALCRFIRPGACCLDLGTGSGILAIAAIKRGAARVDAVDTDRDAVENARENMAANGVAAHVRVHQGSLEAVAPATYDLILANILYSVLARMLVGIQHALGPGGQVVFSGLLVKEQAPFTQALEGAGLYLLEATRQGEWLCVVARKAG